MICTKIEVNNFEIFVLSILGRLRNAGITNVFNTASGIRGSHIPSARVQAVSAVSAVDTHRWNWRSGCTD